MKQFKFLAFALTMMMGLVMTSCLNSDDPTSEGDVGGMVKVVESFYSTSGVALLTIDGYTIIPTVSSVASLSTNGKNITEMVGKVVFALYSTENATVDSSMKIIQDAHLTNYYLLSQQLRVIETTKEESLADPEAYGDSIGNAAILTMEQGMDSPTYLFDDYTLMLPVNHKMNKVNNYLTLVHYTEEPEDEGYLTLYLRYTAAGADSNNSSHSSYDLYAYGYRGIYSYFYDLTPLFTGFATTTQTRPTLRIVAYESPDGTLEDATTKTYEVAPPSNGAVVK